MLDTRHFTCTRRPQRILQQEAMPPAIAATLRLDYSIRRLRAAGAEWHVGAVICLSARWVCGSTPEAPLTTHVPGASRDPVYRRWAARPFRDHPCGRNEASRLRRGCVVLGEGQHRARPTTNVISNSRSLPQPDLIREVVLFSFLAALSPPVLRSPIAVVGWTPPMWA